MAVKTVRPGGGEEKKACPRQHFAVLVLVRKAYSPSSNKEMGNAIYWPGSVVCKCWIVYWFSYKFMIKEKWRWSVCCSCWRRSLLLLRWFTL